jgi:hypothetical protein
MKKKNIGRIVILLGVIAVILFLFIGGNKQTIKVTSHLVEDRISFEGFYFVEEFVVYKGETKELKLEFKNGDLVSKDSKLSNDIVTKNAGMLITHIDGYENKYTRESIKNITAKEVENVVSKAEIKPGLKIVNNSKWYICILLKEDDQNYFKKNTAKEVNIKGKYYAGEIAEVIRSKENTVLVIRFKNDLDVNSLTRAFSGYIVKAKYKGITIPEKAIVEYNGSKSVYINKNGYIAIRKVKILSVIDGMAVVIPEKNSKPELTEYDKIMLNPKGLEEGKKIR